MLACASRDNVLRRGRLSSERDRKCGSGCGCCRGGLGLGLESFLLCFFLGSRFALETSLLGLLLGFRIPLPTLLLGLFLFASFAMGFAFLPRLHVPRKLLKLTPVFLGQAWTHHPHLRADLAAVDLVQECLFG